MKIQPALITSMLLLSSAACSGSALPLPEAPEPDPRLSLSTPRKVYLLGEPVLLKLTYRNVSKEAIQDVQAFPVESRFWIAQDGEEFRKFPTDAPIPKVERRVITLQPGDTLSDDHRILGEGWPEPKLLFSQAGEYRVYAYYPWWAVGSRQIRIASNVVRISVKQPEGADAELFEKLKDPWLMALLQSRVISDGNREAPMKMAHLLRSYPVSGYAPAMRRALANVYFHHRFGLSEKNRQLLAQTLYITDVEALADERLEARRKDQLPMGTSLVEKDTPLTKVLALLSELGLPLDAAHELGQKQVNIGGAYGKIRSSMRTFSDEFEATWERRGDGYFLVPYDADSPKRTNVKGGEGR